MYNKQENITTIDLDTSEIEVFQSGIYEATIRISTSGSHSRGVTEIRVTREQFLDIVDSFADFMKDKWDSESHRVAAMKMAWLGEPDDQALAIESLGYDPREERVDDSV